MPFKSTELSKGSAFRQDSTSLQSDLGLESDNALNNQSLPLTPSRGTVPWEALKYIDGQMGGRSILSV